MTRKPASGRLSPFWYGHNVLVSGTSDRLAVRAERADTSPATELLAAFREEIGSLYGPLDDSRWPSAKPEEVAPPGGTLLVIYRDGEPVACGGVKRLARELGEIKRMYVTPEARGSGVARRLLEELETAARDSLGYERVRLDTGPSQPHARALYESAGYREIPDYNGNIYASVWFEKRL